MGFFWPEPLSNYIYLGNGSIKIFRSFLRFGVFHLGFLVNSLRTVVHVPTRQAILLHQKTRPRKVGGSDLVLRFGT